MKALLFQTGRDNNYFHPRINIHNSFVKIFLSANIIGVTNIKKASKWYADIFGMKLVELKLPYFCEMKLGNATFLIEKHSLERPNAFQKIPLGVKVSAIIGVDDIHACIKHMKKKKVKVIQEPVLQTWGAWNAIIEDPDKNQFILDKDNEVC